MKVRIGFVTNSSSSSFLVYSGNVYKLQRTKEQLFEAIKKMLIEKYNWEEEYVDDEEYVNVYYNTKDADGLAEEIICFSIAMGIPYDISIRESEEIMKQRIINMGFKVINISSETEERWT